ncbi:hypothetical protein GENT5_04010 [Flavobacterium ammoniigenes]|uniref:Redoxin domain-containing protein n=1 Tax=Flavobacterium ammoniigenes TaxID=1751095 RepID=A0ABN6KXQ5_9FLAO|nr:redoxin family protein [Flavobacterium ammoniigenes]BDB54096.1 hypothetical protein GENT5_04010 [Flavobacterium ammoniigenes]
MKKIIILLTLFTFTIQAQVKVGDTIPAFTLFDTNDNKVQSDTFKNKIILIDFWASWCTQSYLDRIFAGCNNKLAISS